MTDNRFSAYHAGQDREPFVGKRVIIVNSPKISQIGMCGKVYEGSNPVYFVETDGHQKYLIKIDDIVIEAPLNG